MIRPSNRMLIPQPPAIVDALRAAGCGIVRRRLQDAMPVMSPRLLLPPPDAVKAVVRRAVPRADGSPSLKSLLLATALVCGVSITDLRSERRHAKSVRARQIYFFVARKLTPRSLPAIGREAGDRDHSTVLHGVRKVEAKRAHFEPELSQILAHFPKDTP